MASHHHVTVTKSLGSRKVPWMTLILALCLLALAPSSSALPTLDGKVPGQLSAQCAVRQGTPCPHRSCYPPASILVQWSAEHLVDRIHARTSVSSYPMIPGSCGCFARCRRGRIVGVMNKPALASRPRGLLAPFCAMQAGSVQTAPTKAALNASERLAGGTSI